ncbi:FAD/NAD(P)-binding protein [Brevundimonas poindexterae]|uniref:FAD/NAD(P)-binding protein n=1 Tax=Brevundimonas poindexterae TaxID=74325 RepID=UPI001CFE3D9F|nr:FAD/NAD(P)-binding protein [Brevundimonas poindexterae]
MSQISDQIVIVGGGFSGAMAAARLAERGLPSTVIDAGGDFGRGVAYSTPFDGHLLNVRSNRMSALEGWPDDFVDWLARHHPDRADPEGFAPRRLFGLYVQNRLDAVEAAHPGAITRTAGRVSAIDGTTVELDDGRRIAGRAIVLATGNPAPRTASGSGGRVIGDPWAPGALDGIGGEDRLIVIGTGLTMVDMAVWLKARGWRGTLLALSRRGLRPRAHADQPESPAPLGADLMQGPASRRLAAARRATRDGDWRPLMEGLRPRTGALWQAADLKTRARWVRHLRPFWDVHRHRIAPAIAADIQALVDAGRLTIVAGRVVSLDPTDQGVTLNWRPKGRAEVETAAADWLIDCTGPGHSPARDPLTAPLIAAGRTRLDPLGLGLDLDDRGRVRSVDGTPDPALFVLGPPARATFWETIAVPDIRKRIEDLVETLAQTPAEQGVSA